MFGKRSPELWAEMTAQIGRIDGQIEAHDDLDLRMAMETIRTNVFFESMPQVQYDLWQGLAHSVKLGDRESMKQIYKNSGCNLDDLVDLLFVADQLAHHNPAVKLENQNFFRVLLEFIKNFEGAQLDQIICEIFDNQFHPIERYLMQLVALPPILHERLDYYVQLAGQVKSIKDPRDRYERTLDLQGAVGAALEQIGELKDEFQPDEAHTYLLLLQELGLSFDKLNLPLIEVIHHPRILYNHLQALLNDLKRLHGRTGHISGFNSIIARIVQKIDERGLLMVINTRLAELYNERLLALARLGDASQVSDDEVIELMLDRDNSTKPEQKWEQNKLRQEILKRGSLGNRPMKLGLKKYFATPSIN